MHPQNIPVKENLFSQYGNNFHVRFVNMEKRHTFAVLLKFTRHETHIPAITAQKT
jgi:hypothetical protein